MAEKRKPHLVLLLRNQRNSKSIKVELFDAKLFGYKRSPRETKKRYRIRVNGKWFPGGYVTKWEFRDLMFRSGPLKKL